MSILNKYIDEFKRGRELDGSDAESLLDALISATDGSIVGELLSAWDQKGIEEIEIYSIAKIMRERMTRIVSRHETFVDIVGTGGSRSKTFNVSTAAAFVVAGAGIAVAKHGNKAATSSSGSADVLSELGIEPAIDIPMAERSFNEIGICFMFAPNFHRLSPTLAKARRGLGFPTIFNCVGPLCNPASVPHQLIGVWDEGLIPKMANALAQLGTVRSWVVHGSGGLDEISLSGPTKVSAIENGSVTHFEITPEDFGFKTRGTSDLVPGSSAESAALIRGVLSGESESSAAIDLVTLNAAAAIGLASPSLAPKEGSAVASESIKSGAAFRTMERLAEYSKR